MSTPENLPRVVRQASFKLGNMDVMAYILDDGARIVDTTVMQRIMASVTQGFVTMDQISQLTREIARLPEHKWDVIG